MIALPVCFHLEEAVVDHAVNSPARYEVIVVVAVDPIDRLGQYRQALDRRGAELCLESSDGVSANNLSRRHLVQECCALCALTIF